MKKKKESMKLPPSRTKLAEVQTIKAWSSIVVVVVMVVVVFDGVLLF